MQFGLALFHLGEGRLQPLFGKAIEPELQNPAELIDLPLQNFALFTHGSPLSVRREHAALSVTDKCRNPVDDAG